MGFKSANAAEEHLKALPGRGDRDDSGDIQGIKLPESRGLPIVGRVAAGNPILAQEHIEDRQEIPATFFTPNADFMLIVRGDSMIDVGIFDGTYSPYTAHNQPIKATSSLPELMMKSPSSVFGKERPS